jgi:tight adherence protein B
MAGAGIVSIILTMAFTNNISYALIAGIVGFFLPVLQLIQKKNKRLANFDEHLPDAMDIMTRALRAGHPFNTTLQLCADELKGPIAEEMAITFAELNFGVSTQDALMDLIRRVPSKALKSLVTAILLQRETGGNLAEILEKISGVIRDSYRFQRKLKTLAAEGKMSAIVLAGVPIALGVGMYFIQPEVMGELFTNPGGITLLQISGALYFVGFIWIRMLIKIEV